MGHSLFLIGIPITTSLEEIDFNFMRGIVSGVECDYLTIFLISRLV